MGNGFPFPLVLCRPLKQSMLEMPKQSLLGRWSLKRPMLEMRKQSGLVDGVEVERPEIPFPPMCCPLPPTPNACDSRGPLYAPSSRTQCGCVCLS